MQRNEGQTRWAIKLRNLGKVNTKDRVEQTWKRKKGCLGILEERQYWCRVCNPKEILYCLCAYSMYTIVNEYGTGPFHLHIFVNSNKDFPSRIGTLCSHDCE